MERLRLRADGVVIARIEKVKSHYRTGWWFGTFRLFFLIFPYIGNTFPIDFHIFQRVGSTTNQRIFIEYKIIMTIVIIYC